MSQYLNPPGTPPTGNQAPPPRATVRGPQRSGLALASMILGILSVVLLLCAGHILGLIAFILGLIALNSIKKSNGMLSGSGMAIAGIILGLIGLVISVEMIIWAVNQDPTETLPETALQAAESNIRATSSEEQIGYGTTEEAAAIATGVSELFQEVRDESFTKAGGVSLSGDRFITHCEIHDDTVAFLIHVPKLRKYDDEAKEYFCALAWVISQQALEGSSVAPGTDMAVGVKGFLLYEKVMLGKVGSLPEDFGEDSSLADLGATIGSDASLERFFPEPPEEIAVPSDADPDELPVEEPVQN